MTNYTSSIKSKYKEAREEMESTNIDYYIVSENSYFDDDVKVKCSKCKKQCYCRPYHPRNVKLICAKCMLKEAENES